MIIGQQTNNEGYLFSKGYTYYVFALLFLLYLFDYIDRMVIVSLFPYLKTDWGLTDAQCGALASAVYWAILVFSFPVSIVVDRWSRKKSIGAMAVLWSIATAACGFTTNFGQLLVARGMIGLGEAGYAPGGTAMLSALFPKKKRSLMVGLWNASIPLGMGLGIVVGGLIAAKWGWRYAFGIVAFPGLLISILFFFVRDYKTVGLEKNHGSTNQIEASASDKKMTNKEVAQIFLRTPTLIFTYLGFAGMMFMSTSFSTFFVTYFTRTQGLAASKASQLTGLLLLTAIIGGPLGGWVADRLTLRLPNARLLVASAAAFVASLLYFFSVYYFDGLPAYILFFVGAVASVAFASPAIAVTQDVIHPGLRAISYALCVIIQHMLGSALGPVVTGYLSDLYDIRVALTIVPLISFSSTILFFIGSRFYEKDLARVPKVDLVPEDNG